VAIVDIDFDKLIHLQELDTEIRNVTLVLEGIPRLIQDIDKRIQSGSRILAEAKDKMSRNQKRRRDLESEVKDLKTQIGKYKRQLNEVKTNKEYTSLLHEIDEAQHRVDTLEETIIAEMLAADDIEEEIKTASLKQGQDEDNLKREARAFDEKARELEAKRAGILEEREALAPKVPAEQLRLYEALSQKKGGTPLSPVRGEFCAMCHMRIRPQMLNEIRDRTNLILCENCGRILYWPRKPETAQPVPAKDE
jgi:predicted  nucleic acid-binding Zn-ribbon protein